jgi:hypothetical protein
MSSSIKMDVGESAENDNPHHISPGKHAITRRNALNLTPRSGTAELYEDLVHYFKYASSAYQPICLRPNGNTLVSQVASLLLLSRC